MSGHHCIRNHPHALVLGQPHRRRRGIPVVVASAVLVLAYVAFGAALVLS